MIICIVSEPSPPGPISLQSRYNDRLDISWIPSSGAVGYNIYVNDGFFGNTSLNTATITSLSPGSRYSLTVEAYVSSLLIESSNVTAIFYTSKCNCKTEVCTVFLITVCNILNCSNIIINPHNYQIKYNNIFSIWIWPRYVIVS